MVYSAFPCDDERRSVEYPNISASGTSVSTRTKPSSDRNFRRNRSIARELHGVLGFSLRRRTQIRRVPEHFRKRYLRVDADEAFLRSELPPEPEHSARTPWCTRLFPATTNADPSSTRTFPQAVPPCRRGRSLPPIGTSAGTGA